MKILFIGQNTFRITLDGGTVLLTDPWFKNNPIWRAVSPAYSPEEIGAVHFVLSSHNHLDHVDRPSLELARRQGATVIGSKRVARRARKFGVRDSVALVPGEERSFETFSVKATPAFHPLAKDAIGFLIKCSGRQIYYSGDTRPHENLIGFLQNEGTIDIAFLQIACARYFGRDDGLTVCAAAEFARAFSPRIVIPMHYHGRFKEADPNRLKQFLVQSSIEVVVIELGREVEVVL